MLKKLKKAFTITELVIVIAVIAILAAVLIPTFTHVVNNAKVSSAMQTCRNALTDYLALVGGDDDPDNDDATGMVFVSDGYAFVYLNSALQQIGDVDNLAVIKNDTGDISKLKATVGITFTGTFESTITIQFGDSDEGNKTITKTMMRKRENIMRRICIFTQLLSTIRVIPVISRMRRGNLQFCSYRAQRIRIPVAISVNKAAI